MKSLKQFVCVMVALTVCVGQLAAEESQGDRFRFSVNTRASYTDNRDAWEADEESNWDFYLRPRIDLLFESESSLFDLFYTPALRYRSNPSDIQNDTEFQHDLGVTAKHRPSRRTQLRVNEQLSLSDDPSVTDGGRTFRGDQSYYLNSIRAGVDHMVTKKSELELYAQNRIKRYDEEVMSDRWDEDRTDVGAQLVRHVSRNSRLTLEGRYSAYGYENSGLIMRDFDSILVAAGAEKGLSKNLSVGGQVGAQKQSYDDAGLDDSTNPFVKLFVRGSTTPAFRLTGSLTHAVRDADAYPFASQEYSEIRGVVDWDTTPKTTLTLSGTYRMSDYEDVVPSAVPLVTLLGEPEGDETAIDVYGQAAFKVSDQLTLLLRQRFHDVDSDVWVSYTKNTTTLELTKYF
ncbi:MAG: hypothetical protein ISS31_08650 [Kiritimatiellae bacterium]|nr:hypothetical protein [Kiritimatiellia bacterium]